MNYKCLQCSKLHKSLKVKCDSCSSVQFLEYDDYSYWRKVALWTGLAFITVVVEVVINTTVKFHHPEGFNADPQTGILFAGFGLVYLSVQRVLKLSIMEKDRRYRKSGVVLSFIFGAIFSAGTVLSLLSPMAILLGFPCSLIGLLAIAISLINWFFWPRRILNA